MHSDRCEGAGDSLGTASTPCRLLPPEMRLAGEATRQAVGSRRRIRQPLARGPGESKPRAASPGRTRSSPRTAVHAGCVSKEQRRNVRGL